MDHRAYLFKDLDYHRLDVGAVFKGETADDYLVRCFKKAGDNLTSGWIRVIPTLLIDRGLEPVSDSNARIARNAAQLIYQ